MATPVEQSASLSCNTGDGSVIIGSYMFFISRSIVNKIVKVNLTDYTDTSSLDLAAQGFMGGDGLCQTGGYLYVGDGNDGYIYKVNPGVGAAAPTYDSTIALGADVFVGITALSTDDVYLFAGYRNGRISSYKLADQSKINSAVLFSSKNVHSLAPDGLYLYGGANAVGTGSTVFKVLISNLTLDTSVAGPNGLLRDDILQDATYFYLMKDQLYRYAKADLALTNVVIDEFTDGMAFDGTKIVMASSASGSAINLYVVETSTLAYLFAAGVTGLNTPGLSNEVLISGTFLHLMRYSSTVIKLARFTLSDITTVPLPTALSAQTNNAGTTISITFDSGMADPAGLHAQFDYKINGGAAQTFSAAVLQTDTRIIKLTCSGTAIATGDTVIVDYTAGTVVSAGATALATFTDLAVTNNMPPIKSNKSAQMIAGGIWW